MCKKWYRPGFTRIEEATQNRPGPASPLVSGDAVNLIRGETVGKCWRSGREVLVPVRPAWSSTQNLGDSFLSSIDFD
jgi:hypothetical protein